jgi:hypothetical protein
VPVLALFLWPSRKPATPARAAAVPTSNPETTQHVPA